MPHSVTPWPSFVPGPAGLDFFQAMRRIECTYVDQPLLGTSLRVVRDPVRISQDITLCFNGVELKACTWSPGQGPGRLSMSSGLTGTDGPMPLHFTEYVWARTNHHGDGAWVAFLDIFHHRMACLLYRAWAINQPVVSMSRPHDDVFTQQVGSLCGLSPKQANASCAADLTAMQFAALLADRRRPADGLAALLTHDFDVPVRVESFIGQWLAVPSAQRACLTSTATLGRGLLLGRKVWDRQCKFRVVVGPVPFSQALRMQPDTPAFKRLASWVQRYTAGIHDWDVEVLLITDTVRPLRLGAHARLARNAWLGRPHSALRTSVRFAAPTP